MRFKLWFCCSVRKLGHHCISYFSLWNISWRMNGEQKTNQSAHRRLPKHKFEVCYAEEVDVSGAKTMGFVLHIQQSPPVMCNYILYSNCKFLQNSFYAIHYTYISYISCITPSINLSIVSILLQWEFCQ